jgi:hypothetical protein
MKASSNPDRSSCKVGCSFVRRKKFGEVFMPHSMSCVRDFLFGACLLALVPSLRGQASDPWPAVPKEDLTLQDNPANPGSAAMILERHVYTDDNKRLQTEFLRIKVFTESGRAYADVEIPYVVKSTSVENIRGRTLQPDGTVVPFAGVVFDKVVAKYKKFAYDAKAFTLPSAQVGSIIEYSYEVHWKERLPDYVRNPIGYVVKDGFTIPTTTWTIQQNLFTRHAVFVLRPVASGFLDFTTIRLANNYVPTKQTDGTVRMEINNVAAIEEEDRMPPRSVLTSRVHFYYRVGPTFNYWTSMSKAKAEVGQKFIEKTHFLEQAASEIAPTTDPPETRLRKLYAHVQRVRYLSYEPEKTEKETKREHLADNKSAEDIFKHNYAHANEINYLFTALARSAGFDASIVEVVDRRSGVFEEQVPDASQLNAIVVQVRLNGLDLYFDPATRFCPFGLVPWFESDTRGIRWDKLKGEIVKVQSTTIEMGATERTAHLKLQPDGSLEGTVEIAFTGQEALDRRLSGYDEDEAGRRRLMEDEVKDLAPPGATIDIDEVTGWQESEQPLRMKCNLHAPRFSAITSRRMVFPLSVFQANSKNPFPQTYRATPVYFGHGYRTADKIEVSLPSGYKLEALPSESGTTTDFAEFHATRSTEAGVVRLERHTEMKGYFFPVRAYGSLRAYFQKLRQSDAQNVVLVKAESDHAH